MAQPLCKTIRGENARDCPKSHWERLASNNIGDNCNFRVKHSDFSYNFDWSYKHGQSIFLDCCIKMIKSSVFHFKWYFLDAKARDVYVFINRIITTDETCLFHFDSIKHKTAIVCVDKTINSFLAISQIYHSPRKTIVGLKKKNIQSMLLFHTVPPPQAVNEDYSYTCTINNEWLGKQDKNICVVIFKI